MENNIDHMVAHFKKLYSTIVPEPGPKFSIPLPTEMEMRARLSAAFELSIERRGGQVDWDIVANSSVDTVLEWMYDRKHRWLILHGNHGTGKTTMLWTLKTIFPASVFYSAIWMHQQFKVNEMLPVISNNKMLLLDDVGAEPIECMIYGEARTPITDMLLRRYDLSATTVIATNLSICDIQARYGDRLADRIAEMAIAIEYDAPSYRGR